MNENEMIEFEGRQYVNPDISRDEQMAFIDTMRDIQAQNNAQIATETHNLGTDIESTRGGLTGSEEYWKSLYQTPQTDAAVANMKAVAQQSALNDALSNYQSMLQNRYNQAYRNYQKRAYNYSRKNSGNGTTSSTKDQEPVAPEVVSGSKETTLEEILKGLDLMQKNNLRREADRIVKEEGLSYPEANKKALKNLGFLTE